MTRLPTFCHPFFNKLTKKLTASIIFETSSSSVIVTFPIATPRQRTSRHVSQDLHSDSTLQLKFDCSTNFIQFSVEIILLSVTKAELMYSMRHRSWEFSSLTKTRPQ